MACNCFEFNGKFYYQHEGIAMGTSCAPSFANLSLGMKERVNTPVPFPRSFWENAYGKDHGLVFYARYMDDIFFVWKGPKQSLVDWLPGLSRQLEPYKITWEIHDQHQPTQFLDIEFFFEQGFGALGLQSRVFRKKLNKHQYIPWSSAHPITVKRAFVKAELTRYAVICSQKSFYEKRVLEFFESLRRRGYPPSQLNSWMKMVKYEDRLSILLNKKTTRRGLPLMLPSSYDEIWEYVDVHAVLERMRTQWLKGGKLPDQLEGPLIKSLRRTENLYDKFSAWNKVILQSTFSLYGVTPL